MNETTQLAFAVPTSNPVFLILGAFKTDYAVRTILRFKGVVLRKSALLDHLLMYICGSDA